MRSKREGGSTECTLVCWGSLSKERYAERPFAEKSPVEATSCDVSAKDERCPARQRISLTYHKTPRRYDSQKRNQRILKRIGVAAFSRNKARDDRPWWICTSSFHSAWRWQRWPANEINGVIASIPVCFLINPRAAHHFLVIMQLNFFCSTFSADRKCFVFVFLQGYAEWEIGLMDQITVLHIFDYIQSPRENPRSDKVNKTASRDFLEPVPRTRSIMWDNRLLTPLASTSRISWKSLSTRCNLGASLSFSSHHSLVS